ncbi:MAG: hypothetical protein WDN45_01110 [Caulobacteraceae bacterium]
MLFSVLSPAEVQTAYEAGVKGCIPKTAPPELITAALRLILAGGLYFSDFSSLSARQRTDPPLRSRPVEPAVGGAAPDRDGPDQQGDRQGAGHLRGHGQAARSRRSSTSPARAIAPRRRCGPAANSNRLAE